MVLVPLPSICSRETLTQLFCPTKDRYALAPSRFHDHAKETS
jgi:hypothetical protein